MENTNERIKNIRKSMHLSLDYVSKVIGVTRNVLLDIESGKRNVSYIELTKFSELYQVPRAELINGRANVMPNNIHGSCFEHLDKTDKREIMNMVELKKRLKQYTKY